MKRKGKEMSKKNKTVNFNRFKEIMKMYYDGDKQKASELALKEMQYYIVSIIKTQFSTYSRAHFQDLLQEGYIGVLQGLELYDINKGMPTTFFRFYIVHNMSEYITKYVNESTAHYQKNNQQIRDLQRKYEEQHKTLTDADISIELGMNIETIKATRKIDGKTLSHIESTDSDFFSMQQEERSPEEMFFETENRKILAKKINTLSPIERTVIKMTFCDQKSQKEIMLETGLKADEVRKSRERGLKQLRMKLRNDYTIKERNQDDDISFVNDDDFIDDAMDMLDLL